MVGAFRWLPRKGAICAGPYSFEASVSRDCEDYGYSCGYSTTGGSSIMSSVSEHGATISTIPTLADAAPIGCMNWSKHDNMGH
jgi:hypothetical protein